VSCSITATLRRPTTTTYIAAEYQVPFSDGGPANNSNAAGRYGRADINAKMCRPQSMFSIACPLSNNKSLIEPLRLGLPRVRPLETRPVLAYDAPGESQCLKSWIRTNETTSAASGHASFRVIDYTPETNSSFSSADLGVLSHNLLPQFGNSFI
jgi:hypothetical protein